MIPSANRTDDYSQDYTSGKDSYRGNNNNYSNSSNSSFQDDSNTIKSVTIKGGARTFYIDLKESARGPYIKFSEKSNGKKSTILMDAEDFDQFYNAMGEIKQEISKLT